MIAAGLAVLAFAGCRMLLAPPSDERMLKTFHEKRDVFEELKDRMCADVAYEVVMMSPERSRPEIGEVEKQAFYRLFKEIGAKGVQSVHLAEGCSVDIATWSVGLAGGGDYKGYRFGPLIHADEIVWIESLDEVDRSSLEIGFFARKIDDDWSLYFDHWP